MTELIIEGLTAAGTVALAVAVAIISWREWRTNELRRNQELFDKRYELFETVDRFLRSLMREGVREPEIAKMFPLVPKARFLFGNELAGYIQEIIDHAVDAGMDAYDHSDEQRKRSAESMKWLIRQRGELADKVSDKLALC